MLFLFRFPRVVFVLMSGGFLGHIELTIPLPSWLAVFFRLGDMLLASGGRRGCPCRSPDQAWPGLYQIRPSLSTRADLLGAEVAADLATLQRQSAAVFGG